MQNPTNKKRVIDLRRHNSKLLRLVRLTSEVARLGDEGRTLHAIVEAAASIVGVESAHLVLVDNSESRLYGVASSGRHRKDAPHLTFKISESPAARSVLKTGRPIAVAKARGDRRVNPHARKRLRVGGALYLPLLSGRRSFGLLILVTRGPRAWSRKDIDLGRHLASSAAVAIENSRLLKRLAEAEQRLRSLVEHIPAIVYTSEVHPPFRTLYISPQARTMLGYEAGEWTKDPNGLFMKIVHPDDVRHVVDQFEKGVHERGFAAAEYRLLDRQGEARWFRDEAILMRDPSGQPIAWHGVLVEISGLKKMQPENRARPPMSPEQGQRPVPPGPA
ncbi:MAG TPA: PAS domain-containing protein [Candidatus Polarisedimenticolia bacterium]|nr:PAS domain-containing protein [Candidatus Polarisedimenticolia bacterium]